MVKGKGHWGDVNFLHDLVVSFYEAIDASNILTSEVRDGIQSRMQEKNNKVTWDGIRNMGRQVMRWDATVHEAILLAVFQHITFSAEQMEKMMEDLREQGFTFTESALRQHIQKLRRSPEKAQAARAGAANETPTKTTPQKRKGKAGKNATPKSPAMVQNSDDDQDELPIKKEEQGLDEPSKKRIKREGTTLGLDTMDCEI